MNRLGKRIEKLESAFPENRGPLAIFRRIVAASDGKPTGKEWFASVTIIGSQTTHITPEQDETDAAFEQRVRTLTEIGGGL